LAQINMKRWVTGLLLMTLLSTVVAQVLPLKPSTPSKDGVEGLVVNSTISANGMVFFLNFLDFWREKPGSDKYTIEIAESASKRLGNQVWISAGQKRVFFSVLPFQRDRIRPLSEQAADTSYAALIALQLPFGGATDPDVAEDEL
jgi:hypothetical protein